MNREYSQIYIYFTFDVQLNTFGHCHPTNHDKFLSMSDRFKVLDVMFCLKGQYKKIVNHKVLEQSNPPDSMNNG